MLLDTPDNLIMPPDDHIWIPQDPSDIMQEM